MPGVTCSRQVQFTAHGPVVIHVLTAPRPGGLYSLEPILSNGTITGRARVTAMEKAASDSATVAGVNGDFFNFKDGHPSGIVMQGGIIKSPPYRDRSSIGISNTGTLNVARVALYGYWQGLGSRHPLAGVNKVPRGDGSTILTSAGGAETTVLPRAGHTLLEPCRVMATGVRRGASRVQI